MRLQKNILFLLTVIASLVAVFMFSCSSGEEDEQNTSSSSDNQSSSSIIACNGVEYNPYSHFCSHEGELIAKGEITDDRNGKVYKIVTIDDLTWMAENLNFDANGSRCYDDDPANCEMYGRLYNWKSAMEVCPEGWHLPSEDEWYTLLLRTGMRDGNNSINNLITINHWKNAGQYSIKVTDPYGFSALPGGQWDNYNDKGSFRDIGTHGFWWCSSVLDEYDETNGFHISVYNSNFFLAERTYELSVRCMADD
jgi:uncharacterized protein (TIGR02145 family)